MTPIEQALAKVRALREQSKILDGLFDHQADCRAPDYHECVCANRNAAPAMLDLLEALLNTGPSHRAPGCWCGIGHNVDTFGHERRCDRARTALAAFVEADK